MIRAIARQTEGLRHEVEVEGHTVVVDEPVGDGGTNTGPSPTRLLAVALASCTALTIEMYATRKEWDVDGLEVVVDFAGAPKAGETASFVVDVQLPEGLDDDQTERIKTIAGKCPVHRTLSATVEIETKTSVIGS